MAHVSTNETVGSRKAVLANDGSGNKSSYTRVFQVIYDATVTDLRDVRAAPGIPSIADPYPTDASTQVAKVDPQEVDGHFVFLVMIEYRIPPIGGFVENPTAQPWKLATDASASVILTTRSTQPGSKSERGLLIEPGVLANRRSTANTSTMCTAPSGGPGGNVDRFSTVSPHLAVVMSSGSE